MAEASSPRRAAQPISPDVSSPSDEEPRTSGTSSRRQGYYNDQRSSLQRPTTGGSQATSKSRGKSASYREPASYGTAGDEAVPPPVDSEAWESQHPRSRLEDKYRQASSSKDTARGPRGSVRRRQSANTPPPISRSRSRVDYAAPSAQQSEEDRGSENPSPFRQRQPDEFIKREDAVPKWLTQLYTVSYLIFFSIWGTLARLGVQWITFYPGTPVVTPVLWANFGGSLIMGFLAEDQGLFRVSEDDIQLDELQEKTGDGLEKIYKAEITKRKKAVPLYIGLATGFCGSFTSFSSFARDVFLALSNNLPTPIDHPHAGAAPSVSSTVSRNGGYSFEASIHIIIYTLALSLGGLLVGAQIAVFLDPITPRIHGSFIRKVVDKAMVVLAFGCWIGAVLLAIFPPRNAWRGEAIFACVFAPLGCLLRWYASLKLSALVPAFPLGTFTVNMFGTAIEGMCFDIQHVGVGVNGRIGGGIIGCQVLQGVMDGFCGCLTTVSTWVAEINGLKRKHGWGYAFGSVLGAFCLMVVIMGSVRWSVGYSDPVCDTGYTSKIQG